MADPSLGGDPQAPVGMRGQVRDRVVSQSVSLGEAHEGPRKPIGPDEGDGRAGQENNEGDELIILFLPVVS